MSSLRISSPWLKLGILLFVGLWVYSPVLQGDWIWDDDVNIAFNPSVHDPDGFWKIWSRTQVDGQGYYYPLELTGEWALWQLLGDAPFGFHVATLLLHLTGAVLLWRLFSKLGLRCAWTGAMLFVVHPLMVETVSWIAEIKNTLSLPPLLLAMLFYLKYDQERRREDLLTSVLFFLISMLCKTTGIMFPFVLVLYAWWKRASITRADFKAILPFLLISIFLGVVMLRMEHALVLYADAPVPGGLPARLATVGWALVLLVGKFFFPVGLLPIYPRMAVDYPHIRDFILPALMGCFLVWLWSSRADWAKTALFGVGFFLINLAPVLWYVLTDGAGMVWSMDHLGYLPVIGLIALAAAVIDRLNDPRRFIVTFILLSCLALGSHGYCAKFINSDTLWHYTLRRSPVSPLAYNNLGISLMEHGFPEEAVPCFEDALQDDPLYAEAEIQDNLGNVLAMEGKYPEAQAHFEKALQLQPTFAIAHFNLGHLLDLTGHRREAEAQFRLAIALRPHYVRARAELGRMLLDSGRTREATVQLLKALQDDPDNPYARASLATLIRKLPPVSR